MLAQQLARKMLALQGQSKHFLINKHYLTSFIKQTSFLTTRFKFKNNNSYYFKTGYVYINRCDSCLNNQKKTKTNTRVNDSCAV